jgi:hypothetical protein
LPRRLTRRPSYRDISLMSDNDNSEATVTITLPAAVIDQLRGARSREGWLHEAALRLARRQLGYDPLDAVGWAEMRRDLIGP